MNFKDIEILNDELGKPYYNKTNKINNLIFKKFKTKNDLLLSISDEKIIQLLYNFTTKLMLDKNFYR